MKKYKNPTIEFVDIILEDVLFASNIEQKNDIFDWNTKADDIF